MKETKEWKINYAIILPSGDVIQRESMIKAPTIGRALDMAKANIAEPLRKHQQARTVIWSIRTKDRT